MKEAFFILIILTGQVTFLSGQSVFDQKIRMEYEDEKLDFIFSHLDQRYPVEIRFNKSILPEGKYTYSFDQTTLSDVLSIICRDNGLLFKEYAEGKVIIFPKNLSDVPDEGLGSLELLSNIQSDSSIVSVHLGEQGGLEQKKAIIRGLIMDAQSNEPLINVMIQNKTTGEFDISDDAGEFGFELYPGEYFIQFTSITHQTHLVKGEIKGSDHWIVELSPKSHLMDEVVISGKSSRSAITETITGLEQLSRREIKQLSTFMGEADVVKSLLTVAGVSTIGEGASGFNVRGGSIDQNLILQDGSVILNPSHLLGFFSTFNPDIVLSTQLNKGHIPAYYGGRISSVLDVQIKEGNYEQVRVNGGFGFISTKLSVETPIRRNRSSLLISGRQSYSGWLKKNVDDLDVKNSQARFRDFHVKFSQKIGDKNKLLASYFQSFDRFQFSRQFGYSWQNRVANIQFKRIQNQHLSYTLTGSYGTLNNKQFEPEGVLAFELSSGMEYGQIKAQALIDRGNHTIRTGGELIEYQSIPEELVPLAESQIPVRTVDKDKAREMAVYVNDQYRLSDNLSLDLGIRFSHFQQLGPDLVNTYLNENYYDIDEVTSSKEYQSGEVIATYSGLEPRISMRYSFMESVSVKMSYNRIQQYIHLLSNSSSPTPVDIWQVSNGHIEPITADNFSIGFYHLPVKDLDYSIDAYYKRLENTVDHKDFADLLLNGHLETEILKGKGRAYGIEISVRKGGEVLSGRLSYSLSKSERKTDKTDIEQINGGLWFPSNYDQPHALKLFINWKLSKRDRFNINFVYSRGRPITAPTSNYLLQDVVIPGFTERNALRLPDYHRLDIGYTFTMNRRRSVRYRHDVTLGLYNLYARRNAFSVFYRQRPGSAINALQLSVVGTVIPSITYNFRY